MTDILKPQILLLPPEILVQIFIYLEVFAVGELGLVCRKFRDISNHPLLWKFFCKQSNLELPSDAEHPKKYFIKNIMLLAPSPKSKKEFLGKFKRIEKPNTASNLIINKPEHKPYDYLFKVIIIGDSGTGKSSLMLHFAEETFDQFPHLPSVVDCRAVSVQLPPEYSGKIVKLQIWDIPSASTFSSWSPPSHFYRAAHAAIIAFDVTNQTSLENTKLWAKEIRPFTSSIFIAGTKADLQRSAKVTKPQVEEYCKDLGVPFTFVSNKTDQNVKELFVDIILHLIKSHSNETEHLPQQPVPARDSWCLLL